MLLNSWNTMDDTNTPIDTVEETIVESAEGADDSVENTEEEATPVAE